LSIVSLSFQLTTYGKNDAAYRDIDIPDVGLRRHLKTDTRTQENQPC